MRAITAAFFIFVIAMAVDDEEYPAPKEPSCASPMQGSLDLDREWRKQNGC